MKEHDRLLIDRLIRTLEQMNLKAYLDLVTNRRRLMLNSVLSGMVGISRSSLKNRINHNIFYLTQNLDSF